MYFSKSVPRDTLIFFIDHILAPTNLCIRTKPYSNEKQYCWHEDNETDKRVCILLLIQVIATQWLFIDWLTTIYFFFFNSDTWRRNTNQSGKVSTIRKIIIITVEVIPPMQMTIYMQKKNLCQKRGEREEKKRVIECFIYLMTNKTWNCTVL